MAVLGDSIPLITGNPTPVSAIGKAEMVSGRNPGSRDQAVAFAPYWRTCTFSSVIRPLVIM
jgi:hypothetical protein